jgi:hypothetical protein
MHRSKRPIITLLNSTHKLDSIAASIAIFSLEQVFNHEMSQPAHLPAVFSKRQRRLSRHAVSAVVTDPLPPPSPELPVPATATAALLQRSKAAQRLPGADPDYIAALVEHFKRVDEEELVVEEEAGGPSAGPSSPDGSSDGTGPALAPALALASRQVTRRHPSGSPTILKASPPPPQVRAAGVRCKP